MSFHEAKGLKVMSSFWKFRVIACGVAREFGQKCKNSMYRRSEVEIHPMPQFGKIMKGYRQVIGVCTGWVEGA